MPCSPGLLRLAAVTWLCAAAFLLRAAMELEERQELEACAVAARAAEACTCAACTSGTPGGD